MTCFRIRWTPILSRMFALLTLASMTLPPAVARNPPSPTPFRPDEVVWVSRPGGPLLTGMSLRETFVPGVNGQPGTVVSGLDPQSPGRVAWDNRIRERGWIDRDGDLWRMWYTGYDGTKTGIRRLGLALSTDGLSWTRAEPHPLLPICGSKTFASCGATACSRWWRKESEIAPTDCCRATVAVGNRWARWTCDASMAARSRTAPSALPCCGTTVTSRICFTSGAIWRVAGPLHRRQSLDERERRAGPVTRSGRLRPVGTGHEPDRQVWRHLLRRPARHGSEHPPRLWNTYFAKSRDLVRWEKPTRAVFEQSANKSSGQLVHDGRGWRLYTFHNQVEVHWPR